MSRRCEGQKVLWQRKEKCVLMLMLWLFSLHIKLLENFCDVLHVTFIASLCVWTSFDRGTICMIIYEKKNAPYLIDSQTNRKQPNPNPEHLPEVCIAKSVIFMYDMLKGGLDSICLSILGFVSIKLKQFMELVKWILKFCDNALTVIRHYCSLSGRLCKRKQYLWSRPFNPNPLII